MWKPTGGHQGWTVLLLAAVLILALAAPTWADSRPVVDSLTATPDAPTLVGSTIVFNATFSDDAGDTHYALWDWGDGSPVCDTRSSSDCWLSEVSGAGSTGGSHTYSLAGIYTPFVTVVDNTGKPGTGKYSYVVVYDRDTYVAGKGWIESGTNICKVKDGETGTANFAFNARYTANATVPGGRVVFTLGSWTLNATSLDWLAIVGPDATFQGVGTINGTGNYGFWLSVTDNSPDYFRLRIWDRDTNGRVYDSNTQSPATCTDTADPTSPLTWGQVMIQSRSVQGGVADGTTDAAEITVGPVPQGVLDDLRRPARPTSSHAVFLPFISH